MSPGDRVIVPGNRRLEGEWRVLEGPGVDGLVCITQVDAESGISIMRTLPVEQLAPAPEAPRREAVEPSRPRVQEVAVLFRERRGRAR